MNGPPSADERSNTLQAILQILLTAQNQLQPPPTEFHWTSLVPLENPPAVAEADAVVGQFGKWFRLSEVVLLNELALVEFYWADPETPDLCYIAPINIPANDPALAAHVTYSHLTSLLGTGWRDSVTRLWISADKVLIRKQDRFPESRDRGRQERWNEAQGRRG